MSILSEKINSIEKNSKELEKSKKSITKSLNSISNPEQKKNFSDKIAEITEISNSSASMSKESESMLKEMEGIQEYESVQKYAKKVGYVSMESEKIKLSAKETIAKIKKKALCDAMNGKDSEKTKPVTEPAESLLLIPSASVSALEKSIDTVLNSILENMIIKACGMSFYKTPKSPDKCTDLTPVSPLKDITIKIPDSIRDAINEAENIPMTINTETKYAKAMEKFASGYAEMILGEASEKAEGIMTTPAAQKTTETVKKIYDMAISPEALPTYEKLSPANISWMIYLAATFEKGAYSAFGLNA